jgi:hypothetical protein
LSRQSVAALPSAYTEPSLGISQCIPGAKAMSKEKSSKKETKKQPLHTQKEKKAAKQVKKHAGEAVPIIVR